MSIRTFTAVYRQEGPWWIGWVEEMPGAIAQEWTLEEARESLRDVIPVLMEVQRETHRAGEIREELSVTV